MLKYYAGIGSRETPSHILDLMSKIAMKLAFKGFILRSGGADGADTAFQHGAEMAHGAMNIYYAKSIDTLLCGDEAMALAKKYHKAWHRMGSYAHKLHGRNAFQILGSDLKTPSSFVICWTKDGCTHHNERTIATGGTGTAISIASMNNIPVFNLAKEEHLIRVKTRLEIK